MYVYYCERHESLCRPIAKRCFSSFLIFFWLKQLTLFPLNLCRICDAGYSYVVPHRTISVCDLLMYRRRYALDSILYVPEAYASSFSNYDGFTSTRLTKLCAFILYCTAHLHILYDTPTHCCHIFLSHSLASANWWRFLPLVKCTHGYEKPVLSIAFSPTEIPAPPPPPPPPPPPLATLPSGGIYQH